MTSQTRVLDSRSAEQRRIDREQQQRHNDLLKRQKHLKELQAQQRAALDVSAYEHQIRTLTSLHKECGERWDWLRVRSILPPTLPEYSNQLELTQRQEEAQHQPRLIDRLFGRHDAMRASAQQAIDMAIEADRARHASAMRDYEAARSEWKALQRIADGVLRGDVLAFKEALDELRPLQGISELGRSVKVEVHPPYADVMIALHNIDHMPTDTKSMLRTGKVSVKKKSAANLNELYQAHCCSCLLRAARELFAALPFDYVYANGSTELLNPRTGHQELAVIVSVRIPRATFETLDFESVDPVEVMRNFEHRMRFVKARGFGTVDKLNQLTIWDQGTS
jgi:hypothetical protein